MLKMIDPSSGSCTTGWNFPWNPEVAAEYDRDSAWKEILHEISLTEVKYQNCSGY